MNKRNKIVSVLMSTLIVFSLLSPAKIKADEDDNVPAEENLISETEPVENKDDGPQPPVEQVTEEPSEETAEEVFSYGYIPNDFINPEDLVVNRNTQLRKRSNEEENDLPSSYTVYLSPIRDQQVFGTCWAFASVASAESTYYKKTGNYIDLSELHLAFFGYHNEGVEDKLGLVTNDGFAFLTEDKDKNLLQTGGNFFTTISLLADGIGFVSEKNMPYTLLNKEEQSIGSFTEILENTYGSDYKDKCYKEAEYYVIDSNMIIGSDIRYIKEAIYNNGAVATCYYAIGTTESNIYYNEENRAYYCYDETKLANHAVTIVGWDDDFDRTKFKGNKENPKEENLPKNNGAWLIKNSWGKDYGDGGYFWLSYEDASMAIQPTLQLFVEPVNNTRIYQHDGTVPNRMVYDSNNRSRVEYANVFTAQEDEEINRVGYLTTLSNIETTIRIYKNVDELPDDGELIAKYETKNTFYGYHTFELPDKVYIGQGEKFSIVITQTDKEGRYVYVYVSCDEEDSIERTVNEAARGQSYFREDGEWGDLYGSEDDYHLTAMIKVHASEISAESNPCEYIEGTTEEFDLNDPKEMIFIFKRKILDDLTHDRLESVEINGKTLLEDKEGEERDYRADSGSLKLTIHTRPLNDLGPGENTLTVNFTNSQSISVKFNVLKKNEPARYNVPITGIE